MGQRLRGVLLSASQTLLLDVDRFLAFIEFATVLFLCHVLVFLAHKACGILAPRPGIEPTAPALEGEVFTTGPSTFIESLLCAVCMALASGSSRSGGGNRQVNRQSDS